MSEKSEFGGWWMWILFLVIITVVILGATRMLGMWGHVAMENVIYKNSYQAKQSKATAIGTFSAQLAEIDHKLAGNTLTPAVREDLEAQAAGLRVLINTEHQK